MSIKAAVSAVALASAMLVVPAIAQDAMVSNEMMIGTQTVGETDVEAVRARCQDLQVADSTQSLTQQTTTNTQATGDAADASNANAGIINEPATDSESATTLDLSVITLEECEAGGWYESAM